MVNNTLERLAARAKSGKPYVVVQLKEALAAHPVHEAYDVYRGLMGLKAPETLRQTRAISLQAVARARAKFYFETEGGGETYGNRPSKVIGEGNQRDLLCHSRTDFVACFEDAEVASLSGAIAFGGQLLFDFEDWEFEQIDDRLELDSRVFRSSGREVWRMDPLTAGSEIDRAFMLTGCHARAFGHWMWEYLPRYVAALIAGVMPPMPVLIDCGMPPQHREALETLLPAGCEAIEVPLQTLVRVKELWCAPAPIYMPLYEQLNEKYRWDVFCSPPWRFAKIMARMAAAVPPGRQNIPGRRLFLARPESNHRKLVNSSQIEAIARGRGFEIVYPERMPFAKQAEMLAEANAVVGPEGSAMFLAYYMRPGTRLAILSHPDIEGLATFTAITEAAGIDTTVVTGPFHEKKADWPQFSDYTIDEGGFSRFLDGWIAGR